MFDIEALKIFGNLANLWKIRIQKIFCWTRNVWAKGNVAGKIGSMAHGLKIGLMTIYSTTLLYNQHCNHYIISYQTQPKVE